MVDDGVAPGGIRVGYDFEAVARAEQRLVTVTRAQQVVADLHHRATSVNAPFATSILITPTGSTICEFGGIVVQGPNNGSSTGELTCALPSTVAYLPLESASLVSVTLRVPSILSKRIAGALIVLV
jgi:hypothetical protein